MRRKLKNALCVFLALVTAFSLASFAFAAQENENSPVIVVSGMGSFPLYLYDEDEPPEQVFAPSSRAIMNVCKKAILPLAKSALSGDWNEFAEGTFDEVYNELFKIISCDENGNSAENVDTLHFQKSVDNYPETFQNSEKTDDEIGIIKAMIEKVGAKRTYFFNYDWRLSPLEHADELKAFVDNVKSETGSKTVTLIPASMGGTVVNSYLYKYGSAGIDKVIYCTVASKGLDMVGELFGKNVEITTDAVLERMFSFEKGDILLQSLLAVIQTGAEQSGIEPKLDKFVNSFILALNDRAYEQILLKSFATMPGMWAFCPDEYFEKDKSITLTPDFSKEFVEKIDEYHYNVQNKSEELMKAAQEDGTQIYIIAAYGFVGFPVTQAAFEQSDCLIETKRESFGAICAPYGENFGKNYKAASTVCADASHNHVSTDGIIDASGCAFPEQTWFIKDNRHVGLDCTTDCAKLLSFFVQAQTQQTVHSNESAPQFVKLNLNTGNFKSLTGEEINPSVLDSHSDILTRILTILSGLFEKLLGLFKK